MIIFEIAAHFVQGPDFQRCDARNDKKEEKRLLRPPMAASQ